MSKIETVVYDAFIVNVETRQVSNGTKTIWEVTTQDGTKWATFNAGLGNKASALKGNMADLQVAIEQKGDFTNYYLQGIQAAKSGAQPPAGSEVVQAAQRAQEAAQAGPQAPAVSYDQYKSLEGAKEKSTRDSIERQVAAKVATTLLTISGSSEDFWFNVESLTTFFATGETPLSSKGVTVTSNTAPNAVPVPSLPAYTGPDPGNPAEWQGTDDDIPF